MQKSWFRTTRYASAVLLITSSIALAFYQVMDIDTIAHGTLMYIAQAFLLAGSIFGLEYYVKKLTSIITDEKGKKDAAALVLLLLISVPSFAQTTFIGQSRLAVPHAFFKSAWDARTDSVVNCWFIFNK